uniref:NADH dehydrogenase subunit 1 n=1 Tax=Capsicum annuum TaxID=4072 RepID=F2VPY6_CAPAN|nr:NADH dehydrogenase subunit 1 [Capsicum annuum]
MIFLESEKKEATTLLKQFCLFLFYLRRRWNFFFAFLDRSLLFAFMRKVPPTGLKKEWFLDRALAMAPFAKEWVYALSLLLCYFSRLGRDSYLMLLSDWVLDSLAELMI